MSYINHGIIRKLWISMILAIMLEGCFISNLYSQKQVTSLSGGSALEAFSKGQYEQALGEFSRLLLIYTKDPLYKYYSGVCLVKLNRDPERATELLQEALKGTPAVKSIPSDGWFFLGRSQQLSGRFSDAVSSYNSFIKLAGRKIAREMDTDVFIQQCKNQQGEMNFEEIMAEGKIKTTTPGGSEEGPGPEPERKAGDTGRRALQEKEFIPEKDDKILSEAMEYQIKSDSLKKIAAANNRVPSGIPEAEKAAIKNEMTRFEKQAAEMQEEADRRYSAVLTGKQKQDSAVAGTQEKTSLKDAGVAAKSSEQTVAKPSAEQQEVLPTERNTGIFSVFEIAANNGSKPDDRILVDPPVPPGLIYRLQMAVFRNPVSPSLFKGITPVYGIRVTDTDRTNYYAGYFRKNADAVIALNMVKQTGFRDAFMVAVMDGRPISLDRAAVLEKEWGSRPIDIRVGSGPATARDTVPPTLSFRVELLRSEKPLKEDVVEGYQKMAGNRGFDILYSDYNKVVYLIGKFITFDSASDYAGLLVRNGYSEAKVSAWLGRKEIPVETAKQLFERPE